MTLVHPDLTLPWRTAQQWHRVNECLAWTIRCKARRLQALRAMAMDLKRLMGDLDAALENLCAITCPQCSDPCCHRATVWYDFRDLLFLHLSDTALPPGQLNSKPGHVCQVLADKGCRLPRIQRPFICSWYVCPAQKEVLVSMAAGHDYGHLLEGLAFIKKARCGLEESFIHVLARAIRD